MLPRIQQQQLEEEQEYQRTMQRLGQAEQERIADNLYLNEDYLGMDDGRPGLGWGWGGITMGWREHLVWYVIGAAILIVIATAGQALKRTPQGQQAIQSGSQAIPSSTQAP
jgi:hypothetical protein